MLKFERGTRKRVVKKAHERPKITDAPWQANLVTIDDRTKKHIVRPIQELYRYNRWANGRMVEAVSQSDSDLFLAVP